MSKLQYFSGRDDFRGGPIIELNTQFRNRKGRLTPSYKRNKLLVLSYISNPDKPDVRDN